MGTEQVTKIIGNMPLLDLLEIKLNSLYEKTLDNDVLLARDDIQRVKHKNYEGNFLNLFFIETGFYSPTSDKEKELFDRYMSGAKYQRIMDYQHAIQILKTRGIDW